MAAPLPRARRDGARVLVVDADPGARRGLKAILTGGGYQVETVGTGREALDAAARWRPDVIVLDLDLPDMDGLEVIGQVRKYATTPIVVLSGRAAEKDKVAALDLGADDYVDKPFGVGELLARIRLALRHAGPGGRAPALVFRAGDLEVNLDRRRVTVGGREIHLSPTEYNLLKVFLDHPNKVLTHATLLRQVWGPHEGPESARYLHVYISCLRKKLEADPQRPRYLRTMPGVGYWFSTDDA